MISLSKLDECTVGREVKNAYADCTMNLHAGMKLRSLMFKALTYVSRDDAIKALDDAGVYYNQFNPKLLMKFPDNIIVKLAREYSVCLYIGFPEGEPPLEGSAVKADEFDHCGDEDGYSIYRYWWD